METLSCKDFWASTEQHVWPALQILFAGSGEGVKVQTAVNYAAFIVRQSQITTQDINYFCGVVINIGWQVRAFLGFQKGSHKQKSVTMVIVTKFYLFGSHKGNAEHS